MLTCKICAYEGIDRQFFKRQGLTLHLKVKHNVGRVDPTVTPKCKMFLTVEDYIKELSAGA